MLVEDSRIIGRPGPMDPELVDDLLGLVHEGSDPGLPGWKLVATALTHLKDSPDQSVAFIAAFAALDADNADLTARVLDNLAALAEDGGRSGEAARRVYLRLFDVVAQWTEELRCRVFAHARVSTKGGGWRIGNAVH